MFCPRCRRHLQSEDSPSLAGGGSRASRNCPVCHTLLAPDRLAPEFPASEEATVTSNLTIQDVLRETASGAGTGSQTPLDEQIKRFRKSIWDNDHESHPGLPLGARRLGSSGAPGLVYIVLGVASLLAILALVVGVFFHTIWQEPEERHAESLALQPVAGRPDIPAPTVASPGFTSFESIPPASSPKPLASSLASARTGLLPRVAGGWKLWKNSVWPLSRLSSGHPGRVVLADYEDGRRIAEISLIRVSKGDTSAANLLSSIAGGPRTVPRASGSSHIRPRASAWNGRQCLLFDYQSPTAGASQLILTDSPYLPNFPHTISWFSAPYVVTVGADTASARDSFARAYLASLRS